MFNLIYTQVQKVQVNKEETTTVQNTHKVSTDVGVVQLTCKKPAFEVGSAMSLPLSFTKKIPGMYKVLYP